MIKLEKYKDLEGEFLKTYSVGDLLEIIQDWKETSKGTTRTSMRFLCISKTVLRSMSFEERLLVSEKVSRQVSNFLRPTENAISLHLIDVAKYVDMNWNVYLGDTLTCNESGEPIKVERIE